MLGVTLAAGCLTVPQTTAEDLAGRAGRNMVEAQQNLAGKRLVVRGVVKETTLAPRSRVVTSGYPYGWTKTSVLQEEQVPLVILQPGSVLCYFEPSDIDEVSSLQAGVQTALKCQVSYFQPAGQTMLSVLAGCRRSE